MKYLPTLGENKVMERMADNKCGECGSRLPQGVARCGNCGAPVGGELRQCPACGKSIPVKSVFCPCCGKMVWNDMEEVPPVPEPKPDSSGIAVEPSGNAASDGELPAEELPASDSNDGDGGSDCVATRHTALDRTITALLVAAVLILAAYSIYDWGGGGDETTNPYMEIVGEDTVDTPDPDRLNIEDASSIYGNALVHDNRIGDKSVSGPAAYAVVKGAPLIVGINYFSEAKQRPFFKLTQVRKIDGRWRCGEEKLRHEDGGVLVFDRDKLKLSGENVPRFVSIDGKTYFYFVYLHSPSRGMFGALGKHHLKLSLFNVESLDVVQLDYECEPVLVRGETLYYGKVADTRTTPEFKFLSAELERLPIVYRPTPEEQRDAAPANASHKWQADNDSLLSLLRGGRQEVVFSMMRYGSPLFSRSDVIMDSRVETEAVIYYATYGGEVFGYDRVGKKFFIAYVDEHGAVPAIEINSNGTLHVVASGVDFDLDPVTGRATLN